jgi:hypothetical protein
MGGMKFTPNLVVGILLTLVGLALTLDRFGIVVARDLLQYWPVALILFGAAIAVEALTGGDQVDPARRPRPIVSPGSVFIWVMVALLVSNASQRRFVAAGGSQEDRVSVFSVMGRDSRTSYATAFRGAQVTTVMGRAGLDLRNATVAPGADAVIDVSGLMGRIEVLVPREWTVEIEATPIMGAVNDLRRLSPEEIARFDDRSRPRRDRDRFPASPPERPTTGATPDRAAAPAPGAAADPAAGTGTGAAAGTRTGTAAGTTAGADVAAPSAGAPVRVVIRGFVMMGALVIRS